MFFNWFKGIFDIFEITHSSKLAYTVEPAMSSHSLEHPTSYGGHLAIPKNDILYTNNPPMSSHMC